VSTYSARFSTVMVARTADVSNHFKVSHVGLIDLISNDCSWNESIPPAV
jgi:hypothetical protein